MSLRISNGEGVIYTLAGEDVTMLAQFARHRDIVCQLGPTDMKDFEEWLKATDYRRVEAEREKHDHR